MYIYIIYIIYYIYIIYTYACIYIHILTNGIVEPFNSAYFCN